MNINRKYLNVEDRPDLVRDSESKAILSVDINKLKEHREKKNFFKNISNTIKEVDDLKQDVKEIKIALSLILEKLSADK